MLEVTTHNPNRHNAPVSSQCPTTSGQDIFDQNPDSSAES